MSLIGSKKFLKEILSKHHEFTKKYIFSSVVYLYSVSIFSFLANIELIVLLDIEALFSVE